MKHPAQVDERERIQRAAVQRMRPSGHPHRTRQHPPEMLQSVACLVGTPKPQASPPGLRQLAVAARNADVAEVLKILGKPGEPYFVELYKVWEIVRHASGMQAAMQSAGISENTMTRFKRTANHQAASGDNARHARLPEAPPPNPMPIGEARALIGKFVNAWIATL